MSVVNVNKRRQFLAGLGVTSMALTASKVLGADCSGLTPVQPEGPFYPVRDQFDKDVDLTRLVSKDGQVREAKGERVIITGLVTDEDCLPIKGALVEIWQACHSGKYNHPGDPNPAELDENFQYWGEALTGAQGEYSFKTILPGAYPANESWVRPPHIHYKITKLGYDELITQLYFSGNPLNDKDLILRRLSDNEKSKVVVELRDGPSENGQIIRMAQFNIVLKRVADF